MPSLRRQRADVLGQHESDLARGLGSVALPFALERKYPRAAWEPAWQWLFPASRMYVDVQTGLQRRHHLHETVLLAPSSTRWTMIYTHVLNRGGRGVRSPLDGLA